jgi:hypothetical protein
MMSANDGPGEEPTRCSAVPSPLPPDCDDVLVPSSFGVAPLTVTAVIDGHHRSLVIVYLLQTVAVIVLVLLLPPERMPIPDRDSRPRRAKYNNDGSPALIRAHGLSSSLARCHRQPALIHPLPPLAPLQHRRRDLCHVQCLLKVTCMCLSVLPSFNALFDFVPRRNCDDRPAPLLAFQLPPPPGNPNPKEGDAVIPKGLNSV